MNSYLSAGVSPVLARRLPPDRPPHFLDYFVPPCRLLLLRIFLFFMLPALASSSPGGGGFTAPVVLSSTPARFSYSPNCASAFFPPPSQLPSPLLSADRRLSGLLCPPVFCLRWPTPTPSSSFLRTRKRLALLTPSRGLALAGLERRPPGWVGHRGRERKDKRGVRLWRDRPAAVSVELSAAEGGERWAGLETPLLPLSPLGITAQR